MINRDNLESLFKKHNYTDFKWFDPREMIVAQWIRMKCMFGCSEYGKTASCPPNVPSVAECQQFFKEYNTGVIFHFEKTVAKPEDRHAWSKKVNQGLLKLEREVFISGFQKAFLLFMDSCGLCAECSGKRATCKNPMMARPSPDSMAVDVFSTVRKYGYPIEVLADYSTVMNRYAFLLIE
jgi:predicted metal-binding protein